MKFRLTTIRTDRITYLVEADTADDVSRLFKTDDDFRDKWLESIEPVSEDVILCAPDDE